LPLPAQRVPLCIKGRKQCFMPLPQRPPPCLRDPHPSDLDRGAAGNDPLGAHAREPGAHKLDHLLDREAVREHDRFGTAVWARGEQFECAAAIGLGETAGAAAGRRQSCHPQI
jgi:hypothetical protein